MSRYIVYTIFVIKETQLKELQRDNITIQVVELLPIENVNRKIPKTGYYNNQP